MGKGSGYEEEDYATEGNLSERSEAWLAEVREFVRRGFEFEPNDSALLVIDMQKYFLSSDSHAFLPAANAVVPNVNALIRIFRKAGRPIIFTRHAYLKDEDPGIMGKWWGDNIMDEDPQSEIVSSLELQPSDMVLRKTRYNAFFRTDLQNILKKRHVEQIVITGVMTHLCCETTAREAFTRDYEVYFTVDGTASTDEEFHMSSIRNLAHGFAIPVSTKEIIVRFR